MKDLNKMLDEHFEWQRIHDLKIDVDTVAEEVHIKWLIEYRYGHSEFDCNEEQTKRCRRCRMHRLYQDLMWFKELL